MSPHQPMRVNRASTEGQQTINRGSTVRQQRVNRASTERQQSVNTASTQHQQSINRVSKECQQPINNFQYCIIYNPHAMPLHLPITKVLLTFMSNIQTVAVATFQIIINRALTILGDASFILNRWAVVWRLRMIEV